MTRHLSDEDLDIIGIYLDERVLTEIRQVKDATMALADTLAQLVAEDTEIKADVEAFVALGQTTSDQITALQQQIVDLQAALANGTITADQLAALQTTADDLAATHAEAVAALPAPVVAPPAAFVMKIDGEDYPTFQARVATWNADPANVNTQATDPGPDAWAALPIG